MILYIFIGKRLILKIMLRIIYSCSGDNSNRIKVKLIYNDKKLLSITKSTAVDIYGCNIDNVDDNITVELENIKMIDIFECYPSKWRSVEIRDTIYKYLYNFIKGTIMKRDYEKCEKQFSFNFFEIVSTIHKWNVASQMKFCISNNKQYNFSI